MLSETRLNGLTLLGLARSRAPGHVGWLFHFQGSPVFLRMILDAGPVGERRGD